ncbi:helix-turn-helix domain-containing protein [Streptomyces sasae]|uniref:helix-turn-helix domain-containing protein n=1 Tax=Streptomyces sasae TaxID=1266772 RepID=UPI0029306774|nr:LuxR C-terminal-related transcriptional regulator [Streptomyces sasae]
MQFRPDRDQLVRGIVDAIADPTGPRAVLILGTGGTGLSTVLRQVCQEFGDDRTWFVAARPRHPHPALGNVLNNFRAPRSGERSERPSAVLAIDDVQWVDAGTLGRLTSLVRASTDTGLRCVCTVRVDVPAAAHHYLVSELVDERLVDLVWLRPLDETGLAALIGERSGAEPTAELVRHVGRLTRNRPKAVGIAIDALAAADGIRVVDLRTHLVRPDAVPTLRPQHRLLQELRGLGASTWSVAKAAAVLDPLGDAMPELVAEATGLPRAEVVEALHALSVNGIVRQVRDGGRWAFRLPLVQRILIGQTGPYERRRLAQVAVTAVWAGRARCTDPDYLADQQASAGRLLDERRAKAELLAHARASARPGGSANAGVWLRVAAQLSSDETERVRILWESAQLSAGQARTAEGLATIESLLNGLSAQPGSTPLLIDIHLAHITMLRATGNQAALGWLARGEPWPWAPDPVVQTMTRAGALYALGRWQQVRQLLDGLPRHEDPACRAEVFDSLAALWRGEPDRFSGHLSDPDQQGFPYTGALLTLGELTAAERMLARGGGHPEQLALADQAVLAARRGEFTRALTLTRRGLAPGVTPGSDPSRVGMIQTAALILLARGQLRRASEFVDRGHDGGRTALLHLLAVPQARAAMALGERQQAEYILGQAIKDAAGSDTVAGTDELWFASAQLAMAAGNRDRLDVCLREAETVAGELGTDRAIAHSLLIRAAVEPRSGTAALRAARALGQPFELAMAVEHLVRAGAADPRLLREAYGLLGPVDALLVRARMRTLMRENDVAVPDRQAVVEENERLLAVLVAQGFGNQQISALLGVSRRSVESRLTRLFSRSGYRSRLELAMAMLRDRPEPPVAVNAS